MKYVIKSSNDLNLVYDLLSKDIRTLNLHFLKLPFGLTQAYKDVAVDEDLQLTSYKVAWLLPSNNPQEMILLSRLKKKYKEETKE